MHFFEGVWDKYLLRSCCSLTNKHTYIAQTQLIEGQIRLGNGGFCDVYMQRLKLTTTKSTSVAIKTRPQRHISSQHFDSHLKNEADILLRLNHPSIISLIGIIVDTNKVKKGLVLEFCRGGSLFDLIHKHKALNEFSLILKFLLQISHGMVYLHKNFLHLDLKPQNILVKQRVCMHGGEEECTKCGGTPVSKLSLKIADFGVSRCKADATECGYGIVSEIEQFGSTLKGTIFYIAPEILEKGIYKKYCDIYSFAVIMWEMITGEEPFSQTSPIDVYNRWLDLPSTETIFDIPSCPKMLSDLMTVSLTKCYKKRPSFPQIEIILQKCESNLKESIRNGEGIEANIVLRRPSYYIEL